jgi:hypothetical protein
MPHVGSSIDLFHFNWVFLGLWFFLSAACMLMKFITDIHPSQSLLLVSSFPVLVSWDLLGLVRLLILHVYWSVLSGIEMDFDLLWI